MIVLYILGGLLAVIVLILLLPLSVEVKFDGDFLFKVKFAGFKVYPLDKKTKKPKTDTPKKDIPQKENLFGKLVEKKGFKGTIREIFLFFRSCLNPLKAFLRFIKFRKIKLNLIVAGDDVAKTAIDYGAVCAAVYPVLSLFDSIANVKYKKINLKAGFEEGKSSFDFSLDIKISLLFILIFGVRIFKEYKKFSVRNDLQ